MVLLVMAGTVMAQSDPTASSFVAPVTNQANSCTVVVNPGQSIQDAVNKARNGAVVCVRGGTYVQQVKIKQISNGITLMAYPGEQPILDGQNRVPALTAKNRFAPLLLVSGTNVTVDGFVVQNSTARGVTINKTGVTVRNMVIQNNNEIGLVVTGPAKAPVSNVLIENNVVYNNLLKNSGGTAGGSALTFVEYVQNSTARGNRVHHNYGEGLVAGRRTSGIVLEDNTTYDNRGANLYLVNTTNPVVRRNFIFCTNDPISWRGNGGLYRPGPGLQIRDENFKKPQPSPSSGQIIVNNMVVGCGSNFGVSTQIAGGGLNNAVVANNSFINARSASGDGANNIEFDGRASYRNTQFINNLVLQSVPGTITRIQYATGTPDLSSLTVSNNLYSKNPTNGWVSSEPGRIVADPLLANPVLPQQNQIPTPALYTLQAGSPAIDQGANIAHVTDDLFKHPRSQGHDIGADEVGGTHTFRIVGEPLPTGEGSQ